MTYRVDMTRDGTIKPKFKILTTLHASQQIQAEASSVFYGNKINSFSICGDAISFSLASTMLEALSNLDKTSVVWMGDFELVFVIYLPDGIACNRNGAPEAIVGIEMKGKVLSARVASFDHMEACINEGGRLTMEVAKPCEEAYDVVWGSEKDPPDVVRSELRRVKYTGVDGWEDMN